MCGGLKAKLSWPQVGNRTREGQEYSPAAAERQDH